MSSYSKEKNELLKLCSEASADLMKRKNMHTTSIECLMYVDSIENSLRRKCDDAANTLQRSEDDLELLLTEAGTLEEEIARLEEMVTTGEILDPKASENFEVSQGNHLRNHS